MDEGEHLCPGRPGVPRRRGRIEHRGRHGGEVHAVGRPGDGLGVHPGGGATCGEGKDEVLHAERVDLEGHLTPDDIKAVDQAIANLESKFQENAKFDDAGYKEAKAAISAVKKLTKMLTKPNFEEILQTLDQAKKNNVEPTVTDLIGFMKHFNLRFGAAKTEKQAQALADLFPKMDQIRDEVLSQSKDATPEQIAVSNKNLAEVLDKLSTDDKTPPPGDGSGKK